MATQVARTVWNRASDDQEDLISDDNEGNTTRCEDIENQDASVDQVDGKPVVYTSQWATLIIIVNVTVGVGLLAMPFGMQSAGIIASMIVQLLFLVIIIITCIICTELTVKSEVKSYHEIIQKHCHPYIYQFTQVAIFLLVFGTTVAYIVTIGDQSDRLFKSLTNDATFCHKWYMNRNYIMIIATMLAIKPLCSARTVDFLKYASFLGIISIGFIFFVVLNQFAQSSVAKDVNYYPEKWANVATILPVFCLGYQCHLSLVPTVGTIHRRQKPMAFITTTIAMIVAAIIYSAVSIFAVMTFGNAIEKDLIENYAGQQAYILVTIAIVAIKCILTLPAAFLPARISLIDILTNNWIRFSQLSETTRRISVTFIFLDAALLLALTVPDIVVAVNFLGCLAVMFIFQLPGLAYLSLIRQNRFEKQHAAGEDTSRLVFTNKDKMKLVTSYFLIVIGFIMTIVVLYKSIKDLLNNTPSAPLCHT